MSTSIRTQKSTTRRRLKKTPHMTGLTSSPFVMLHIWGFQIWLKILNACPELHNRKHETNMSKTTTIGGAYASHTYDRKTTDGSQNANPAAAPAPINPPPPT